MMNEKHKESKQKNDEEIKRVRVQSEEKERREFVRKSVNRTLLDKYNSSLPLKEYSKEIH
jgi:hypothetical protein